MALEKNIGINNPVYLDAGGNYVGVAVHVSETKITVCNKGDIVEWNRCYVHTLERDQISQLIQAYS